MKYFWPVYTLVAAAVVWFSSRIATQLSLSGTVWYAGGLLATALSGFVVLFIGNFMLKKDQPAANWCTIIGHGLAMSLFLSVAGVGARNDQIGSFFLLVSVSLVSAWKIRVAIQQLRARREIS